MFSGKLKCSVYWTQKVILLQMRDIEVRKISESQTPLHTTTIMQLTKVNLHFTSGYITTRYFNTRKFEIQLPILLMNISPR